MDDEDIIKIFLNLVKFPPKYQNAGTYLLYVLSLGWLVIQD